MQSQIHETSQFTKKKATVPLYYSYAFLESKK